MEMTKYRLGDVGKIVTGKTPSTSKGNYFDGDIPFITPEDIAKGYRVVDSLRHVSIDGLNSVKTNSLSGFSVLVGCIGSDMGNVAFSEGQCVTNQQINSITEINDGFDPKFVYYLLSTKKTHLRIMAGATTTPLLPKSVFENIQYNFPPLPEQKKIASVLSTLDEKIALNKKMNQKLETMAKRLYDYWFVQYDFPDKNGHPYKTTGGPMTYNPTLKREIPVGWDVSSFSDFGFFKNGINYDKNEIGDETVKIVNVRNISDSTTYFNIDELDDITLKSDDIQKFIATPKDILLARSGSPGATRLLPQTDKKIIYCGFIIRYQLNEQDLDKQLYLFHVLKGYEQVTSTQSAGSILKNISQDTLNALTVVMPQSSVLDAFNKRITPIYSMLRKNISEQNKLTTLRDKLLPLLMNGQVVVG